ncbi:hypothetical protein CDL15_Pgr022590 [Punica granatum]|uniref:Uncharacterized protein n=1 Tax=Punica granatum TaxID=22663 RepID=A0A218XS80_PUNGR|nr:hypothetical protein CDL15_Pgr022590 [Punica granatum]
MVQKKRLDNRSIGFQVSTIPRAPRSARRRGLHKKTADNSDVCPIELLASLAGKLLQETESSASNTASEENDQIAIHKDSPKDQIRDEDKPLKSEEQGSCGDGVFMTEQASEISQQKDSLKRSPEVESDALWDCSSVFTGSACSEKESSDAKSTISKSIFLDSGPLKFEKPVAVVEKVADLPNLKDSMGDHVNMPCFTSAFSPRQNNGMKLDRKDDDENFSRFNKSQTTKPKPYRHSQHIVDRRIRKLLNSKHWNVAPQLKDCEHSKADGGRKLSNLKRRTFYSRERYHRDFLHKRRKLLHGSSIMISDGILSSDNDSSCHQKVKNGECGAFSPRSGDLASFDAKNSHVKFSIKSFKIPELFIDVPETATVGSLKRTIMEAVTAILGRGLRVGVLLRGKKIRDDSKTLLQTGISCEGNLDTLGFTLEPNLTQPPPTNIAPKDSPCTLPCRAPQQLTGSLEKPIADMGLGASDPASDPANLTDMCNNNVDNSHELIVSSNPNIATDTPQLESRAIVPLPETNLEPLAIVPANQKNKRTELSQRRIRRPFSVSEVEALVQAVEELGTGRWRDVKLRAFENADHRTYVDLKDKWKTLVHTASIAPQQRRGEPVPQELLDRVMAAHSYWSQHQSKQNGKTNAIAGSPLKITDGSAALTGIGVEGI